MRTYYDPRLPLLYIIAQLAILAFGAFGVWVGWEAHSRYHASLGASYEAGRAAGASGEFSRGWDAAYSAHQLEK